MTEHTCQANAVAPQRQSLQETLSANPSDLAKCSAVDVPSTSTNILS